MSFSPQSGSVGSWTLLCFTFTDTDTSPVKVDIVKHQVETITEQLSREEPCVQVFVPAGCSGMTAMDQSQQANNAFFSVS